MTVKKLTFSILTNTWILEIQVTEKTTASCVIPASFADELQQYMTIELRGAHAIIFEPNK